MPGERPGQTPGCQQPATVVSELPNSAPSGRSHRTLRSERGNSVAKYEASPAKLKKSLRPQFGKIYDQKKIGNIYAGRDSSRQRAARAPILRGTSACAGGAALHTGLERQRKEDAEFVSAVAGANCAAWIIGLAFNDFHYSRSPL